MEKIILHIDVNSAFLSWTAVYRIRILGKSLDLRNIPSVIGGDTESRHGIVLAKSIPAKAYGIKTGEPLFQAKQKCPRLVITSPDYNLYVNASRKFIQLLKEMAPKVEQYSIDEAWIDLSGTEKLYGQPYVAAEKIRNRIKNELGFTVNIGISSNKLLAKTAGDFTKPDQIHTLFPYEIKQKLWSLPVRNLFYIGPATEKKLNLIGICSIGQLATADLKILRLILHKQGELLWNFANGCCEDPVTEATLLNKGYGNSVTAPKDFTDSVLAHKIILSLCETVTMRMRKDGQYGSCITVSIRTHDFRNFSHQGQIPQPTDVTIELYKNACRIFDELWDQKTPLRQIGVHISKIYQDSFRQYCLFESVPYEKLKQSDFTVDRIRERFGENAIIRACFLKPDISPMEGGLGKHRRTGLTKPV